MRWLGHAHEITAHFAATQVPVPPPPTTVTLNRSTGRLPGGHRWTYLKVYGSEDRAHELLTTHLPHLLDQWPDTAPHWWFTRYRDPDPHLRLRLHLAPHAFGDAAHRVSTWAAELRAEGLLTRVQWDTDQPEIGRYGTGAALAAAERVFVTDSAAATAQIILPQAQQSALIAASFVDICTAFLGSPQAAWAWLLKTIPQADGHPTPRDQLTQAVRLAAPDTTAVNNLPGGDRITAAWTQRRQALTAYRQALETAGINPADVLPSLLHMHHNRAAGIDPDHEATCRRLARAAALSWTHRTQGAPR